MLRFLALLGLLLTVFSCCCQANLTKAQKRVMQAVYDDCTEDLDIPLSKGIFERASHGGMKLTDEKGAEQVFCTMVLLGFARCDGTIGKQELIDFFTDGHDITSLPGVIDECDRIKSGSTVSDRSYSFYRCFFDQKKFII